jgi:L-threonylcarbamoyladenylate synthase
MNDALNHIPAPLQEIVQKGIEIIKKGGIVAYPTDTIYGLGADTFNKKAVERVYTVKNRPREMALPVLLASIEQIKDVARDIPDIAWQLAREFMPGGLTLVLYKSPKISDIITAGGDTIAVRVPGHAIPIALIEGAGAPIVGTSANLTGKPNPLTALDVKTQLGDKVDLIIDGGRVPMGKESTIIDCTGQVPALLREGAIDRRNIERICEVC